MPRKFAVITALTLGAVMSGAGVASAGDTHTHVSGGDGFASSPLALSLPPPQALVAISVTPVTNAIHMLVLRRPTNCPGLLGLRP